MTGEPRAETAHSGRRRERGHPAGCCPPRPRPTRDDPTPSECWGSRPELPAFQLPPPTDGPSRSHLPTLTARTLRHAKAPGGKHSSTEGAGRPQPALGSAHGRGEPHLLPGLLTATQQPPLCANASTGRSPPALNYSKPFHAINSQGETHSPPHPEPVFHTQNPSSTGGRGRGAGSVGPQGSCPERRRRRERTRPAAEGMLLPTAATASLPPGLTAETHLPATGRKG